MKPKKFAREYETSYNKIQEKRHKLSKKRDIMPHFTVMKPFKVIKNKLLIASTLFLIATTSIVVGTKVYASLTDTEFTACVEENGILHLVGPEFKREDCKKRERLLTWNRQGLKGDTGPQGPKGEDGDLVYPKNLHLLDGHDNDLGLFISRLSISTFDIFSTELGTSIRIDSDGEIPSSGHAYFTSEDCTGTPYTNVRHAQQYLFRVGFTTPTTSPRFFVTTSNLPIITSIGSTLPTNNKGCYIDHFEENMYSMREVVLPFPYPPIIPLQIKEQ